MAESVRRSTNDAIGTAKIVEERLKEQRAEGIRMPEGIELDKLALRILLVAGLQRLD